MRWCWVGVHDWRAVGINPVKCVEVWVDAIGHEMGRESTIYRTIVLYRCPCGAVESREIAGAWTLADVRGEVVSAPECAPAAHDAPSC